MRISFFQESNLINNLTTLQLRVHTFCTAPGWITHHIHSKVDHKQFEDRTLNLQD